MREVACGRTPYLLFMYLWDAGQLAGDAERQVGALVREGRREDLAGLHVHADPVDHRPVDAAPHGGVQLADARQRQVDLDGVLVEAACETQEVASVLHDRRQDGQPKTGLRAVALKETVTGADTFNKL